MGEKQDRDIEKVYSTSEFVAKLRRLADALEAGKLVRDPVAGERSTCRPRQFNVEHEREGDEEESGVPTQVDPLLLSSFMPGKARCRCGSHRRRSLRRPVTDEQDWRQCSLNPC